MGSKVHSLQFNKRQTDTLFYVSLAMLALFVFLFVGSDAPVLFDDSGAYMRVERFEGVMPVYPLFLLLNQYLFGSGQYLQIVIVEQALVAAACVILFVREIREYFGLWYWEGYLLFFLSLLSFTTEMPEAMITQTILTEGLAYALFYLLMILFLRVVRRNSYRYLVGSFLMVFFLSMLRSQLQILFGVCGILFLVLTWRKVPASHTTSVSGTAQGTEAKGSARLEGILRKTLGFLAGIIGCMVISLTGICLAALTVSGYYTLITDNMKINMAIMKIQEPEYYEEFRQGGNGEERAGKEIEQAIKEQQEKMASLGRPILTSQYTSLIFSRGMYEADEGDRDLFEDQMIRGLYETLYAAADEEGQRYVYAQKGLWMWKDIVGGIGSVGKTAVSAGGGYFQEDWPEIYEADNFNEIWNHSLQTIGMALVRAHFGRFVYHTLMMLPQAFICTVFFQIKPIYLLCHLVTLFLYLSAFALMIWGYADRKAADKCAEFMMLVLGCNLVMVLVISMVFFGQQRYLVYNFGIFYTAYYVLLRELWNCRISGVLAKRLGR